MRTLASLAALGFLFITPAVAQTPAPPPDRAKVAAAREVYDAMHPKLTAEQVMKLMPVPPANPVQAKLMKTIPNPPGSVVPSAADQAAKQQRTKAMYDRVQVLMREAYVNSYAARFTLDELKDLKRFYQSPLGRKLTAQQVEMAHEVQSTVMPRFFAQVWSEADSRRPGTP